MKPGRCRIRFTFRPPLALSHFQKNFICSHLQKVRGQGLRFGKAKYIFRGALFLLMFYYMFNKNVLARTRFGGIKNIGGPHSPNFPRVYGPGLQASIRVSHSLSCMKTVIFCLDELFLLLETLPYAEPSPESLH